mmetsp:Transcript_8411/g.22141  ORF Transcript_8411/g.22141 Transcript_8411/m.22141 type:complete len:379 (-) Transcript_8411:1502-2638(-)
MPTVQEVVHSTQSYPAQFEVRVVSEANELVRDFPSLAPETGQLRRSDGSHVSVLSLRGVLPITYRGANYNIPVQLFVTERFPNMAPLVYVTPTPAMVVRHDHPYVDKNGLVRHPYLMQWNPARCCLAGLGVVLVNVFSQKPPVYARPTQNISPYPSLSTHNSSAFRFPSEGNSGSLYPSNSEPLSHHNSSDAMEARNASIRRRELLEKCNDAIRRKLNDERDSAKSRMLELYQERHELSSGASTIQEGFSSLHLEADNQRERVQELQLELGSLETWLEKNKGTGEQDNNPDALMSRTTNVQQDQVLRSSAENLALQDLLYALEEGMDAGLVDVGTYLKETRKIGRKQFYARALIRKIQLQLAEEQRSHHASLHAQVSH